ncbi:MAG: putative Replication protein A 70 kDa DNA-binding subunit [Streblomastix strix]|uniref:Replication protein A subunit n=1 Tax=Streblomastix strix TaxID=222440 RepID=A0A5J4WBU9_9EUKA|nr:MAG: putative Replication protein A 70 kDa DNA-binding subunit [Streblomastix strix]
MVELTTGAVERLANNLSIAEPILQIVSSPNADKKNELQAFKIYLSDGNWGIQCIVAKERLPPINTTNMKKFSILKLTQFETGMYEGKVAIIIYDFETVLVDCNAQIGQPKKYATGTAATSVPAANKAPPQQEIPRRSNSGAGMPPNSAPSPFNASAALPMDFASEFNKLPLAPNGQVQTQPIASLTPYSHSKWCIKARITVRSDIKTFVQKSSGGQGRLLSCDILDEEGGETRIVCFNQVLDKFEPILHKGGIYYIHKGSIKTPQNKRFCRFDNEITLELDSVIVPVNEDSSTSSDPSMQSSIPKMKWDFIDNIANIEQVRVDVNIDVVGIVIEINEPQQITLRQRNVQTYKRSITIVDDSQRKIEITFWGNQATDINNTQPTNPNSAVFIKFGDSLSMRNVRVGEFQGKNLTINNTSYMEINDQENRRCVELREWWEREGKNIYRTFEGIRGTSGAYGGGFGGKKLRCTFMQAISEGAGTNTNQPDYFSIIASPMIFQRENMFYSACPNEKCGKKVDGNHCQACQQEVTPTVRFIVNLLLCDPTGAAWIHLFSNNAEQLFKMKAPDMFQLEKEQPEVFEKVRNDILLKPKLWRVKASVDSYQDQMKTRYTCIGLDNILYAKESREFLSEITEYLTDEEKERNGIISLPPNEAPDAMNASTSTPGRFEDIKSPNMGGFQNQRF